MNEFEQRSIDVTASEYRSQRPIQVSITESGNDRSSILLTEQEALDLISRLAAYLGRR